MLLLRGSVLERVRVDAVGDRDRDGGSGTRKLSVVLGSPVWKVSIHAVSLVGRDSAE